MSLVKGVSKEDEQQPPSWDPLGAAPFAWDLPEPGPATPPAPPKRRRAPVTLVTLGLALLAGAGTGVVLLTSGVAGVPTFPVLLGVVAAVLGLGLVVGSFLRAGRGLIPFAVLVSLLIWGALSAPWHRFGPEDGFGELKAAPTTVAQLQPEYRRGAGDVTLDLRGLDLSPAPVTCARRSTSARATPRCACPRTPTSRSQARPGSATSSSTARSTRVRERGWP